MSRKPLLQFLLYAGMVVYASLFPGTGWRPSPAGSLSWLTLQIPPQPSKSDLLVNLIAYLPVGFLALGLLRQGKRPRLAFAAAVAAGCVLSLAMEFTQTLLPSRTPSVVDLAVNALGTFFGACAALAWQGSARGVTDRLGREHLREGTEAQVALLVLLMWALSQLAPFVPSLDLGGVKNGLKPLWHALQGTSPFRLGDFATYSCYLAALGVAAQLALRPASLPLARFALFALAVFLLKPFVHGRQLSPEALCGLLAALPCWFLLSFLADKRRRTAAAALVLAGFAVYQLKAGTGPVPNGFNWVPFGGQLAFELHGFGSILEGAWPFAALSLLCTMQLRNRVPAALAGALLVPSLVLFLEWLQLSLPGRFPDITQVLLALAGWLMPFWRHLAAPAPARSAP